MNVGFAESTSPAVFILLLLIQVKDILIHGFTIPFI
jgi:hypothetical protein